MKEFLKSQGIKEVMKNILSFVCRDCENTILTENKIYIIKLPRWLVANVYMEKKYWNTGGQ